MSAERLVPIMCVSAERLVPIMCVSAERLVPYNVYKIKSIRSNLMKISNYNQKVQLLSWEV